nr:transmembrane protein C6orf70 [Hymenolepis microstoma]
MRWMASSKFYPESFLSPRAKELFCACGKTSDSPDEFNCPCVTCDGFIIVEHIAHHLEDFVEKEDYLSAIQSIAHTMQLCQRNFYIDAFHYNPYCLKWLSMPLDFVRLRNSSKNHDSIDRLLAMLQVTSMLEFSISHLLIDENGHSPNHFNAALEDEGLEKFLNPPTRSLLKILFGPVNSLNLRNILWHGFLSPHDMETLVPECILYFLFALVLAIDEQLTGAVLSHSVWESKLSQCFKILTEEILIQDSYSPTPKEPEGINAVFLKPFVELFIKRRYFDANCIGVLCINSILRNEFCKAINWPEGVLTSEDRFFLTLDGILKMQLYKSNHHPVTLEDWLHFEQQVGSFNLLLLGSVFTANNGPRLRKHIAHGELFVTSITDSPMWEGIARRLKFCVFLLLNQMRSGSKAVVLRDLVVRPDAFNPLGRYATATCGLWTTWATLYHVYSELNAIHPTRSGYIVAARKWFPQLPDFNKINLNSVDEAAQFLPSVDISRLWIWKAHYFTKFKGLSTENQSLSECRYQDKRNPFKTAQWLTRVVQSLDKCLKEYFDRYLEYCDVQLLSLFILFLKTDKYYLKPDKVADMDRFCRVIISDLLAAASIPVMCCCYKECIWKTWFSGAFLARECDEFGDLTVPKDSHVLINSFDTWESKIKSVLKTCEIVRIEKALKSLWIPHPESQED